MKVPYFRGVFIRDDLPVSGPYKNESAIVNLDSVDGPGTHWVAYKKRGSVLIYFDSFGDLSPPIELIRYFHSREHGVINKILYNYERQQQFNTVLCGHLCLKFLSTRTKIVP